MAQAPGQGLQNVEVRPALDVQDVTPFQRPDVVLGAIVLERIADIGPGGQIVDPPPQQQREMAIQRFVENDLRMGHQHDLRLVPGRDLPQEHVDLLMRPGWRIASSVSRPDIG